MVEECSDPKRNSWAPNLILKTWLQLQRKHNFHKKFSHEYMDRYQKSSWSLSQHKPWIVTRIAGFTVDAFVMFFFLNKWLRRWTLTIHCIPEEFTKDLTQSYSTEKQILNIKDIWHKHKSIESPIQNMQASFPFFPFLGFQYFLPSLKSSYARISY